MNPKIRSSLSFGSPENTQKLETPTHKSLLAVPCQREDKSNVSSGFLVGN